MAMQHMAEAGPMPPVKSSVEMADRGVTLLLTPEEKTQLEPLRTHIRAHQQRMEYGECWVPQQQSGSAQDAGP